MSGPIKLKKICPSDYWSSVAYRLDNAVAVTSSANITATQLADGDIQIDVAAGKTPDANPTTGFTIAWLTRDSITKKLVNFTTGGGYQGVCLPWLGVVSGLGGLNNIELSIGTSAAANLLGNSVLAASLNDQTNRPVAFWRWINSTSSLARTIDGGVGATNLSTAVLCGLGGANVSTNFLLAPSSPNAIGLTTLDPRLQLPPGNPFDIAVGAGSVGVGPHIVLNVRNAGLANVAAARTYVLRPRVLTLDWRA